MHKQNVCTPKSTTRNLQKLKMIQTRQNTPGHNLSDSSVSLLNRNMSIGDNTSLPALSSNSDTPVLYRTPTSRFQASIGTPDCYSAVTLETPKSKEQSKLGKLTKLNVTVRVRPLNYRELNTAGVSNVVQVSEKEIQIASALAELSHRFQYDNVLWSCDPDSEMYAGQEKIYSTVGRPLLEEAFEGYNTCLFAYGQTGSGKSYSMMGTETLSVQSLLQINDNAGIIPRFCCELFKRISTLGPDIKTTIEISYFEIYNEKIHDLLSNSVDGNSRGAPLKVREHPVLGPYVVDLSVHPVNSYGTLCEWLCVGNKQRATAATAMNDKSSRSHSIFSVVLSLSSENISRRSKINLVDLAGSERLGNIISSDERLKQGVSINKSLLTLGKVIAALAEQKRSTHVPYRESVLTWLLRESLGGNSRTCMLATITPASCHVDETLSTLRYASQARTIVNRMRVNEDPQNKLIRELKAEVERLKAQKNCVDKVRNSGSQTVDLNERIETVDTNDNRYIVENRENEVVLQVMCNNTSFIENDICLLSGERLVINGGHSFKIEKIERYCDEIENDINCCNLNRSDVLEELENSIMVLEEYQNKLECKNNVYSTPDQPNDISPYYTNFFEELQSVLAEKQSPLACNFISPRIKTMFNNSPLKKSTQKHSVNKYLAQLKDATYNLEEIFKNDTQISEAVRNLNSSVSALVDAIKLKKQNKSVSFDIFKE